MNRKLIIMGLLALVLLTISTCAAQEDNSTESVSELAICEESVLEVANETHISQSSSVNTHIDTASKTDFDVIGDYFKVKLSDSSNNVIKNAKVTFTVNGKTYNQNTDSSGIASLQLRLNDGTYKIVTKYAGNANYKASSLTTTVKITNTRVVDAGLSNSEIQSIIDNAKANNVILFKGSSYSDVSLVITKSLTLLSNSGTTLKSGSSSPVITVKGKSASLTRINGFDIEGAGDGIRVDGSDYVTIINNDITTKGNGIVSLNTKYLNVTGNDIVKNSKSGISIAESSYSYIFNNKITNNNGNGIEIAKSDNIYIHGNTITNNQNGIYLAKKINGINYKVESTNVHINKNTIDNNYEDGILVFYAGKNLKIGSNSISNNKGSGISLAHVQSNTIQSNVIYRNSEHGIRFYDLYQKPSGQEISYNAIYDNRGRDLEAKETYFQENGVRLDVGDNWYTDLGYICPKVDAGYIKFAVKQIGPNKFQASFYDSNGNIASLLPDRTLTYQTGNGQILTMTIKGGTGVFTVDANDGDLIKAVVDKSKRDNIYDSTTKDIPASDGKSPSYEYPTIPNYQIYEDIENGGSNGNSGGTGHGSFANSNSETANSNQKGSDNTGNGTHSQRADPSNNANNPISGESQSYDMQSANSQSGASGAGQFSADSNLESQSVVKQIIIDEDEFFKVTGISFIILLIILTIGLYYREDIREMKSKL
ncbi:MAG: right-handed parallel beta-helix repeat-containing protein [Methanobrevibacter sp.]|nr:right-handed parallel beta-helix repeat-containing protein [Methanobrevibacter sp.]